MIRDFFDVSDELLALDAQVLADCAPLFASIDETRNYNQLKMLKAFTECKVSATHLVGTTGYGYDDAGREKLGEVFARLVGAEDALYRPHFLSGTHALTVALFGVLRTGDTLCSVTGRPYDTLCSVIGLTGEKGCGSLADFGVNYSQVDLNAAGEPDLAAIEAALTGKKSTGEGKTICYIQRSRGYADRPALSPETIGAIAEIAHRVAPGMIVMVDNCYGEFTQKVEPTQMGADVIIGSLIKNPGGGIAPTGGYIAGRHDLVELCAQRLTAPGTGREIGCTQDVLRQMYLGLYFAPGVTAEALKTAVYAQRLFAKMGFRVTPAYDAPHNDIVTSVECRTGEALVALCAGIQAGSPVDSYVAPEPWLMPGYENEVVMAAGAFTMGSSIELSCDGPLRDPYSAYMQGGLNFTASRAGLLLAAQKIMNGKN